MGFSHSVLQSVRTQDVGGLGGSQHEVDELLASRRSLGRADGEGVTGTAASEAFDEPLTTDQVLAMANLFIVS